MAYRTKIVEVLAGTELLRVNSLHKPLSPKMRKTRLLSITALYFFGILFVFWFYWHIKTQNFIFPLFLILTMLYGILVAVLFSHTRKRANPLIFTDRGLAIPDLAANYWDDIESYTWEEFTGKNRVFGPTVFSLAEGICLRINHKGYSFASKWLNGRGGNIMAINLIFFSQEQIEKAERLFNLYAVRKTS